MQIETIKTRVVKPPKDDIFNVLDNYCPILKDGDILLITSKVIAIHQGLCIPINSVENKDDLIKKEADYFVEPYEHPLHRVILTIKDNTLIPSAGIDESNANGYYILWPKSPEIEAKKISEYLKAKFNIKDLAVIITDSHTSPMRYGTTGISTGFYGLEPLRDYVDKEDIFGRPIKMTQSNVVDALATVGVLAMGEGNEQTPMAIIRGAEFVNFTNESTYEKLSIPIKDDIYYPLLSKFKKIES